MERAPGVPLDQALEAIALSCICGISIALDVDLVSYLWVLGPVWAYTGWCTWRLFRA